MQLTNTPDGKWPQKMITNAHTLRIKLATALAAATIRKICQGLAALSTESGIGANWMMKATAAPSAEAAAAIAAHIQVVGGAGRQGSRAGRDDTGTGVPAIGEAGGTAAARAAGAHFPLVAVGRQGGAGSPSQIGRGGRDVAGGRPGRGQAGRRCDHG